MSKRELLDAIRCWLELFDERMSDNNIPIHERPIRSAMWLVQEGAVSVNNGSKENYWNEEWFCVLASAVHEWYADRYGAISSRAGKDKLSGIVTFHRMPTLIAIPVTTSRVETENETAWLTFPDRLQGEENVFGLFQSKPNINSLEAGEQQLLLSSIKEIVHWSRSVNLNLQSASCLCEDAKAMVAGVWLHFEKAVSDILTLSPAAAAVGCWELHLCVEKSFKIFCSQNNNRKSGHCLDDLHDEAKKFGLVLTPSLLPSMPHWKEAIQYRYGEKVVSIDRAIEIYRVALQLVFEITQELKKEMSFKNASILLKKPKWVGYEASKD